MGDPRDAEISRLRAELAQYVQRPPLVPTSGRSKSSALAQAGKNVTNGGGAAYKAANAGSKVDRMVLVSRDGKPRVRTPSQQQMQEKRQLTARSNDLNAVSNLPNY